MQLDIRLPHRLLSSILGVLLLPMGLGSSKDLYQRPLSVNINF